MCKFSRKKVNPTLQLYFAELMLSFADANLLRD